MNNDNYWAFDPESTPQDRELAKRTSPDLNTLNPIRVDSKTTIYVTDEKLKLHGKQYFIDKVKNKNKKI